MDLFSIGLNQALALVEACLHDLRRDFWINAVIGLLAGLAVVLIAGRMKLFIRKTRTGRIFSLIFRIYIPLICASGFAIYDGVLQTRDFLIGSMKPNEPMNVLDLTRMGYPFFQQDVKSNWDRIEEEQKTYDEVLKEYSRKIHFNAHTGDLISSVQHRVANILIPKVMSWGLTSVTESVLEGNNIQVTEDNKQDQMLNTVRNTKLIMYSRVEFWQRVQVKLEDRVINYFDPLLNQIVLFFALAIFLPIAETIISHRTMRRY